MEINELREKTTVELEKLLTDSRNKLREMRFKVAAKQLSTVRNIRETRRLIARLLTLLAERHQTEGGKAGAQPAVKADKAEAKPEVNKDEPKAEAQPEAK